ESIGGSGITVFVDNTGHLGTVVSAAKYKEDITDMADASEKLFKLRPVEFVYKGDEEKERQYGLIAEEVEEICPELVVYNAEGEVYSIKYHLLPVMLLNELKKERNRVDSQDDRLDEHDEELDELKRIIQSLLSRILVLESKVK
ncbi:MAG TPA: tail fiber domain-containing protein, partial [Candidatus Bathyarchaeia archaeon]|nr:tail fiber domain-containing protein [Candidatus Bathyarchaeia archaeon]